MPNLLNAGFQPGHQSLERNLTDLPAGDDDPRRTIRHIDLTEGRPQAPLCAITFDRRPDPLTGYDSDRGRARSALGTDHRDPTAAQPLARSVHMGKTALPSQRDVRCTHAAFHCAQSGRKPTAALLPSTLDDGAASLGPHAGPETVLSLATANIGLIGTFHAKKEPARDEVSGFGAVGYGLLPAVVKDRSARDGPRPDGAKTRYCSRNFALARTARLWGPSAQCEKPSEPRKTLRNKGFRGSCPRYVPRDKSRFIVLAGSVTPLIYSLTADQCGSATSPTRKREENRNT